MKVCVLGHNGMLGHVVSKYFREAGCIVTTLDFRFDRDSAHRFTGAILESGSDWCVNCIGLRAKDNNHDLLLESNVLLPTVCARALHGRMGFIHASSDAVFRVDLSERKASDLPDAVDAYGRSKAAAEEGVLANGGTIVRCSIIGPELSVGHSLLSWFLRQSSTIHAYTNHMWNGITTLEWAKICLVLARKGNTQGRSIIQPGIQPPLSKAELLRIIKGVWKARVELAEVNAPFCVDRTLVPNIESPGIIKQLADLHEWYSI
jgi:dTDP-4-dehydrorhamnose reductase